MRVTTVSGAVVRCIPQFEMRFCALNESRRNVLMYATPESKHSNR